MKIKELERALSKKELEIGIAWDKRKDWLDIYEYKGEQYVVINPKYGGYLKSKEVE